MKPQKTEESPCTLEDVRLLTHMQTCSLLGVTPQTLYNWRCRGLGPAYFRRGRFIRYRLKDIKEWQETRLESVTPFNDQGP